MAIISLASCQNREQEKSEGGIVSLPLTFVEGSGRVVTRNLHGEALEESWMS